MVSFTPFEEFKEFEDDFFIEDEDEDEFDFSKKLPKILHYQNSSRC